MSSPLFTQEKMRRLIDEIAAGKSMAAATALAYGTRSKSGWVHYRNARKDREAGVDMLASPYHLENWPEEGEHHWLDHAFQMAQEIAKRDFAMEVIQEIRESTRVVLSDNGVVYEKDPKLLAEWSNAEDALTFGGITDWPYKHDENGARVPLRVRDRTSAALTIKALQAVNPEQWDRPQQIDVRKQSRHDVVLVIGEKRAREQQKADTTFERADIEELRRLAKLPPKNPRPTGPVNLGNGGSSRGDPQENVSNMAGDDASRPLSVPRLPPPSPKAPEPMPDYGRRSASLDSVNRKSPMPSGGFSMTQLGPGGRPKAT